MYGIFKACLGHDFNKQVLLRKRNLFSYLWPCYILLILHLINLVGNFYIHVCLFLDLLLVNYLLVNVQVDYKLITCIINKVYSWFISGIILFPTFSHMGKKKMKYSTTVRSEVFSSIGLLNEPYIFCVHVEMFLSLSVILNYTPSNELRRV